MSASLSSHIDNLSEINKKEPNNKFIDDMRSTLSSLTSRIDDVSEINKKDDVSEINKKLSLIELTKKFSATYQFCNKDLNKFELFLRKGVYPYE